MDETSGPGPEQQAARRREPAFNLAGVIVAVVAICAGVHLVRYALLDAEQDFGLILRFAFIPVRYSGGFAPDVYAFVSPLTYSLLHGDLTHLAVNMIWLAAFGSPLANRIGAARFLLFWAATALGAAGLHFVLYPDSTAPLVGASGSISGMMGAAARLAFRVDRRSSRRAFAGRILSIPEVLRSRQAMTFLVVWMAVNLVAGIGLGSETSQIAWEAHVGGFLVGFFAIRLFDRLPPAGASPEAGAS